MATDVRLQEAIEAINRGQRAKGRDLLTRLLKADQTNPAYWLWMSAAVESPRERIYCLQAVLRLDPGNHSARQGLILAGAIPPQEPRELLPPVRRSWEGSLSAEPARPRIHTFTASPLWRAFLFAGAVLLLIGLVLGGIFGLGRQPDAVALQPTLTPGPPPTFTATPTLIPNPAAATQTPEQSFSGHLWIKLEATYTPTPIYVNTPHAVSEAFRAGQRAFARGDWPAAVDFFRQAGKVEPGAADIPYLTGVVLLRMEAYDQALEAFDQAIAIDPDLGPAYLGRAQAFLALNNSSVERYPNVEDDFQKAIDLDAGFGETYLYRAGYWLERHELQVALEDLESGETWLPGSPLLYLYRARADLLQGNYRQALQYARKAYEIDLTLLPVYLTLGQAALVNREFEMAREALQTYLHYEDDAVAWLALGQALAGFSSPLIVYDRFSSTGMGLDYSAAIDAFDQAEALDPGVIQTYFYRGLAHLALEQGQEAVNDLLAASRHIKAGQKTIAGLPAGFEIHLGLSRALWAAGRLPEAYTQINSCLNLAQSDEQLAAAYFWRAQIFEARGDPKSAIRDWQTLLTLPKGAAPPAWLASSRDGISRLATPTATFTLTAAATATHTVSPTSTVTFTPTATKIETAAYTVSPTATATRTPRVTQTDRPEPEPAR